MCMYVYIYIYIYIYSQAPFNYINSYSTYVDILHLPSTVIYSHPGPSACFSRVSWKIVQTTIDHFHLIRI